MSFSQESEALCLIVVIVLSMLVLDPVRLDTKYLINVEYRKCSAHAGVHITFI